MFSCNYRNAIVNIIFRMQQGTEGTSLYIRNIPKLTLFPRVSKTSKANFGYRLTIFREHFFKHRFFKDDKLVILTLMKGDEVIELRE